jgi:cytosine/adenosine deaminase-related metal-dependent hydrolase
MVAGFCSMPVPGDAVAAVARPALAAMLRAGFTAVVDAGGPGPAGVAQAAVDVGIRAVVGPSLADQWHGSDGRLAPQADPAQLLDQASAFVERHDGGRRGRLRATASVVHPMACSDELLAGIAQLSECRGLPTHAHCNISQSGVEAHRGALGRGQIERLVDAGLLGERCTIMHAGSLTNDEIDTIRASGAVVNHNPTGNALHGFGVAGGRSVPRLVAAEVPVVLGSDYAPTVANPFELVRAALMINREIAGSDDAVTLEQALTMATAGAVSLGRPGRLGRIAAGQLADLVLIDTSGAHHLASGHPTPAVALHARPDDVRTVIVGGEVLVDDHRLVAVDEHALVADARHALDRLAAMSG